MVRVAGAVSRSENTSWLPIAAITGINAPGMIVDRAVLEAAGVELPDPETWTWEDFAETAAAVSENSPEGTYGSGTVFTHDSIGLGEDGPTHQSVEHVSSLRLIPGLDNWRPCDTVESQVAWGAAVQRRDGPSTLIFSRQNLPLNHS